MHLNWDYGSKIEKSKKASSCLFVSEKSSQLVFEIRHFKQVFLELKESFLLNFTKNVWLVACWRLKKANKSPMQAIDEWVNQN